MKDYSSCTCGLYNGAVHQQVAKELTIKFPDIYHSIEGMISITKANQRFFKTKYCLFPFCRTVEAENYGADISLGNSQIGPRVGNYIVTDLSEINHLPSFNYQQKRMAIALKTCQHLVNKGDKIIYKVHGPLSILAHMIDLKTVFKEWRKHPNLMPAIFDKFNIDLLSYFHEIVAAGADVISFEDPIASLNFLGPKLYISYGQIFLIPFITQAIELINHQATLYLCPKLSYQLIHLNFASWSPVNIGHLVDNPSLSTQVPTVEDILWDSHYPLCGQICIHHRQNCISEDGFNELILI